MSILIRILSTILSVLVGVRRNQATLDELSIAFADQQDRLDRIEQLLLIPGADHFVFTATVEGHTTEGATNVKLTDSQKATLSIQPKDKKGADAALDGAPVWASSDETIATVEADEGGLSATLTAVRPGSCTVTATADADITPDGVASINGSLTVNVTAGQAVQIDITAGAPVDQ